MSQPEWTFPADGDICVMCNEEIDHYYSGVQPIMTKKGLQPAHPECRMLSTIGHEYGVCWCTGFDTSHASALELRRRVLAAGREGA